MNIIEQLQAEVSERAGSPEGFLHLIQLIIREVERIDFADPEAPRLYVALLRAYVLVKRQLAFFNKQAESIEMDTSRYLSTFRRLKDAIKAKRGEARQFAAQLIPPEKLKELKRYAGTHLNIGPADFTTGLPLPPPPPYRHYMGHQPMVVATTGMTTTVVDWSLAKDDVWW